MEYFRVRCVFYVFDLILCVHIQFGRGWRQKIMNIFMI